MSRLRVALRALPVMSRFLVVGAGVAGTVGAVAGLVIGLAVYPPTAWFAMFEVGIPSAAVGAVVGVVSGGLLVAFRQVFRRRSSGGR